MSDNNNDEKYREKKNDDSDESDESDDNDDDDNNNICEKDGVDAIAKNRITDKINKNLSIEQQREHNNNNNDSSFDDSFILKPLTGLHLTFNLEAGSLLPLAIKGRVMHGRHFTFKSILSHSAITMVAPSVTGTLVSCERPYVLQGPWLQVLIPDQLAEKMAYEFQLFNTTDQVSIFNLS